MPTRLRLELESGQTRVFPPRRIPVENLHVYEKGHPYYPQRADRPWYVCAVCVGSRVLHVVCCKTPTQWRGKFCRAAERDEISDRSDLYRVALWIRQHTREFLRVKPLSTHVDQATARLACTRAMLELHPEFSAGGIHEEAADSREFAEFARAQRAAHGNLPEEVLRRLFSARQSE